MDMSLSKLEIVKDSLVRCSPWGHKELDITEQLNNEQQLEVYTLCYLKVPSPEINPKIFMGCLNIWGVFFSLLKPCSKVEIHPKEKTAILDAFWTT